YPSWQAWLGRSVHPMVENDRSTDASHAERLVITGVSVAFGGVSALVDVSLSLSRADIVGLIGPNGAGKTTLLNVISGYTVPDRGRIEVGDSEIVLGRPHRVTAQGIARTFQAVRLFPRLSVRENLEVAAIAAARSRRDRRAGRKRETAVDLLMSVGA